MKSILSLIFAIGLSLSVTGAAAAQGMMDDDGGHTAREEAEGEEIWKALRGEDLVCGDLSEDQFGSLGEYFMGQMLGDSHVAMNVMMIRMIGEEGEEEMHVVMGKRLSGCDASVAIPARGAGFLPMMQMMMGIRLDRDG